MTGGALCDGSSMSLKLVRRYVVIGIRIAVWPDSVCGAVAGFTEYTFVASTDPVEFRVARRFTALNRILSETIVERDDRGRLAVRG